MKTPDQEQHSLGSELKKIRIQKHLSLEKISQKTRISIHFLEAIENDRFDFLNRPYVLAFLKAYAHVLGLNAEEVKDKFNRQIKEQLESSALALQQHVPQQSEFDRIPLEKSRENHFDFTKLATGQKKPVVLIAAIAVFIILILSLQKFLTKNDTNIISSPPDIQLRSPTIFSETDSTQLERQILHLRLVTGEQLWISIIVDDGTPAEYMFQPGESYSWNAQEKITIRAGKSTGFDLFLNEKRLQNLGTERTMIGRLVLTKEGVDELRILNRTEIQPQDSTGRIN